MPTISDAIPPFLEEGIQAAYCRFHDIRFFCQLQVYAMRFHEIDARTSLNPIVTNIDPDSTILASLER